MSVSREQYRIENVQKSTVNGKSVKLFKAYEYDENQKAYVFCGQFSAPPKTANKNLKDFINN